MTERTNRTRQGEIPLSRDSERWLYDWMVKETGRVFHFQPDGRGSLPTTVRQHDMIAKQVGRRALYLRALGFEEERAGHEQTALELFFDAANLFGAAQHTIFANTEEKLTLHAASIDAFDHVRALAPYEIEHVVIPWAGQAVYGNLHLAPVDGPAPCVIFIPGCDMTKEMYPYPPANHCLQRGMHVISIDGPGQGESNIAGIPLTDDNYERATRAVVDYLDGRPEVDSSAIGVFGMSFGSFWAARAAAYDDRIAACVLAWASIGDKRLLMDVESPRFKRLFAYLTHAQDEAEVDAVTSKMTLDDQLPQIECPTLLTVGEYDPRSPLPEILELYASMTCHRQLWVHEDLHHLCTISGRAAMSEANLWNLDSYFWALDWLRDRFDGAPVAGSGSVRYVGPGRAGPNGTSEEGASWFDVVKRGLGASAADEGQREQL